MTFSKEWDNLYRNNQQMSIWPWSDLISYIKRYTEGVSGKSILELGCGAGANIPFFVRGGGSILCNRRFFKDCRKLAKKISALCKKYYCR